MGPARSHCATLLRRVTCDLFCVFIVDAQAQLNLAVERERTAVEKEMRLQSRVNALETQLSGIRQEKSQLLATVELERAKLETLEEGHHR